MFSDLISDPPPLLVFEVAEDGVTGVRRDGSGKVQARAERPFESGVVEAAATRPNVRQPEVVEAAVQEILESLGSLKRTETALLLPDASTRLTVVEIESWPTANEERLKLLRERLAKTVPFDMESTRIAYQADRTASGYSVLVAMTPVEIVRQYEEVFDRCGLWPGYVEPSMSAALNLLPEGGMTLLAKLSGTSMTIAAVEQGLVRMIRGVDVALDGYSVMDDMIADLYPTRVFVEDQLDARVEQVALAGFGDLLPEALERLPAEMDCAVGPLEVDGSVVGPREAGIWGYLQTA